MWNTNTQSIFNLIDTELGPKLDSPNYIYQQIRRYTSKNQFLELLITEVCSHKNKPIKFTFFLFCLRYLTFISFFYYTSSLRVYLLIVISEFCTKWYQEGISFLKCDFWIRCLISEILWWSARKLSFRRQNKGVCWYALWQIQCHFCISLALNIVAFSSQNLVFLARNKLNEKNCKKF